MSHSFVFVFDFLPHSQLTFRAMKNSRFSPDHLAYTWLLEIGLKVLASPDNDIRREEFVTSLFKQCCTDGLLSSQFLKKLSSGPFCEEGWTAKESKRICDELLGDPPFPNAWSRNMKIGQGQLPQAADLPPKIKAGKKNKIQ